MEPRYNEIPRDRQNYIVLSGHRFKRIPSATILETETIKIIVISGYISFVFGAWREVRRQIVWKTKEQGHRFKSFCNLYFSAPGRSIPGVRGAGWGVRGEGWGVRGEG